MKIQYSLIASLILLVILGCSVSNETTGTTPSNSGITPDPMTDMVIKADLIVLGTITEKRYDVVTIVSENSTGKFAYTLFTLSVEKVIKGNPDTKEVSIKVEGGPIGEVYQLPTGAYFSISDRVLVLLHLEEGNVYTKPYGGIVWSESPAIGAKSNSGASRKYRSYHSNYERK